MNQQRSITLSISQPCHESWNEMTPADKGRFCLNCRKTVTDFTRLSDTELIELLQSKQASSCGRFLPGQLDRALNVAAPVRERHRKPFMSIAAIATALIITIPSAKAANAPDKVQQTTDKENKPVPSEILPEDSTRIISGIVRADRDSTPMSYVTVKIKNTNIGTVTDLYGKFKLQLPANFRNKVVTLEVTHVGYEKKSIKIILTENIKPLDVLLHDGASVLGQWGFQSTTNAEKDRSLWKKFSGTMRNIFS